MRASQSDKCAPAHTHTYTTHTHTHRPMDAGFTEGQVCTNGKGSCPAGTDLKVCAAYLERTCGTINLQTSMLLDTCGGHASPYHYHADLECDYNSALSLNHSALIAFGLDGRGLYGKWEGNNTLPVLDACGGHVGNTPSRTITDSSGQVITIPAQSNAYHYHIIAGGPTTISCFGKSNGTTTTSQAKAAYPTCDGVFTRFCTSIGQIDYDLDCPIFNQQGTGATYNLDYFVSPACTNCTGSCPSTSGAIAASQVSFSIALSLVLAILISA